MLCATSPSTQNGYGRGTLDLVFDGARAFDPRITFTRSTTATRTNASGLLETVPINVPRIDYDSAGAVKGLLIEEARTNLLTYSEAFDNGAWSKAGTCTVSANSGTAPDGAMAADMLNLPALLDRVTQLAAVSGSTAYTFTAYLSGTGTVYLSLASSGGVYTSVGTAITLTATPTRYQIGITTNSGNTGLYSTIGRYDGNFGAGTATTVLVFGAQLEAGAFATSYIPTTSAQVTRGADVAVMTGSNFSDWYRQDEGTFVATYSRIASAANSFIFEASDGTFNNGIFYYNDPSPYGVARVRVSASDQALFIVINSGGVAETVYVNALAVKANDYAAYFASALFTDTSGTMPTVDRLNIGSFQASSQFINGHIKRLTYYPSRLTNAQLQGLTS